MVLAELKGHVQQRNWGTNIPLANTRVALLIFFVMQRDNLGYREKLGACGSVHGAGAAVGGRATIGGRATHQPCLCGAARPVPGARMGSRVCLVALWLPFRAAISLPLTVLRVTLGGMQMSAASRAESLPPSWSSLHRESRRLAGVETSPLPDTCVRSGALPTSKGP